MKDVEIRCNTKRVTCQDLLLHVLWLVTCGFWLIAGGWWLTGFKVTHNVSKKSSRGFLVDDASSRMSHVMIRPTPHLKLTYNIRKTIWNSNIHILNPRYSSLSLLSLSFSLLTSLQTQERTKPLSF